MFIFIRSTIFNVFLVFWTVFITTFFLPTVPTKNQKLIAITALVWSKVTLFALRLICGIHYKIEGTTLKNIQEPCIIASKHQSMWETVFFMAIFNKPVFILKEELTKIPFYGWYLKWMGMIAIRRNDGVKALKNIITETKRTLQQSRSIVIFPEGTRLATGTIIDLQPGVAAIANAFPNIDIFSVALNSGKFWPKGSWNKYPGTISVFITPLGNIKNKSKQELLEEIKHNINYYETL
jgi:1-acyl-sn-glycerol-3-phosphate acyltransferase